jgi:hypothetical protein
MSRSPNPKTLTPNTKALSNISPWPYIYLESLSRSPNTPLNM